MTKSSIRVNITAANTALLLLFGSAVCHSCAKYFYFQYRLVFGTLFPAYSSYKAVKNRDVREYSRWMMYWIVFALFSFAEVFADIFIGFWLPFYYETKILFVLWLMSPYGNGSKILYLHFIHPQLTSHEQIIDTHIDSIKQMGISTVFNLWVKVTQMANKALLYFFQFTQTLIFYQMQNNSINSPQIQSQRLLTQSNEPNFFQQFMFVRPQQQQPQTNSQPHISVVDGPLINSVPQNLLSQRWFSAEALNVEMNEELSTPSHQLINLRMRCESESNLDDWEQMEINEIDGKPPLQPKKVKKRTKTTKSSTPSERPVRKTRAAALKAREKCKLEEEEEENLPEEY